MQVHVGVAPGMRTLSLRPLEPGAGQIVVSPDGRQVALLTRASLHLFDAASGWQVGVIQDVWGDPSKQGDGPLCLSFCTRGSWLVMAMDRSLLTVSTATMMQSNDPALFLLPRLPAIPDGQSDEAYNEGLTEEMFIAAPRGALGVALCVAATSDARPGQADPQKSVPALIAVGTDTGALLVYDRSQRNNYDWRVLRAPQGTPLRSLCFSADGRKLAAGFANGPPELWDPKAGSCTAVRMPAQLINIAAPLHCPLVALEGRCLYLAAAVEGHGLAICHLTGDRHALMPVSHTVLALTFDPTPDAVPASAARPRPCLLGVLTDWGVAELDVEAGAWIGMQESREGAAREAGPVTGGALARVIPGDVGSSHESGLRLPWRVLRASRGVGGGGGRLSVQATAGSEPARVLGRAAGRGVAAVAVAGRGDKQASNEGV